MTRQSRPISRPFFYGWLSVGTLMGVGIAVVALVMSETVLGKLYESATQTTGVAGGFFALVFGMAYFLDASPGRTVLLAAQQAAERVDEARVDVVDGVLRRARAVAGPRLVLIGFAGGTLSMSLARQVVDQEITGRAVGAGIGMVVLALAVLALWEWWVSRSSD